MQIAKAGNQEIAIRHFTTDITQLPYWMDGNCYIVFSLLWRKYISDSINEKLITKDGWFQYTMKSLKEHAGFKDKGTLHRTVEGLYRNGLVDVRVENGSRMWACWRMNKEKIEYISSIPDRDALQEPYINSITTISSSDKNFTYQLNNEGIGELMKYFMVNPVENPPLFNTIIQQDINTLSHKHITTSSPENNNSIKPYNSNTTLPEDKEENIPDRKMDFGINDKRVLEKEMEAPVEKYTSNNNDKGDSELKSKNEIEMEETPNEYQSMNNNSSREDQDSIPGRLREEESGADSSSQSQNNDKVNMQQEGDTSSPKPQLTEKEELELWKKLVDPELERMTKVFSRAEFHQKEKIFYQFYKDRVSEVGFVNEDVKKHMDYYIDDFISSKAYVIYCKFK